MKFVFTKVDKLPALSWLAIIESTENVKVYHGSQVECRENFFVAGVWDGDFESGSFDQALSFHGTGAVLRDSDSVIFATPNHLQDSIYSICQHDSLYISNSVPFLLAYTGNALDTDYYGYEFDFNSIFYGIKRCSKTLRLKNGSMKMHRYCNLKVCANLACEEMPKECKASFSTFEEYKSMLQYTLSQIVKNATDEHRNIQYKQVTTISKGYDASAASALVHDLGCNTAITFSTPEKYKDDSGVELAHYLAYEHIIEGDGEAYKKNTDLWEAESASCGDVGCIVPFNTFENIYKDSLLFLGLKGDAIWGKNEAQANRDFDFISMSIAAEQNPEHFLRNNTLAISVPLILGYEWPSIYKINNSSEMAAYSVGGDYDRPIPRRIVEEKGVPRTAFGFKKHGAGFTFRFQPTIKSVRNKMSPTSYASLLEFRKKMKRSRLKYLAHACKYFYVNSPIYMNYILGKIAPNKSSFRFKCNSQYISSPVSSLLILWGMDVMIKRYKKALEN